MPEARANWVMTDQKVSIVVARVTIGKPLALDSAYFAFISNFLNYSTKFCFLQFHVASTNTPLKLMHQKSNQTQSNIIQASICLQ